MIDHFLAWPTGGDGEAALGQRQRLRAALAEVERLAGDIDTQDEAPEQVEAQAAGYAAAAPVARRRFDALVAEASAAAAAGIAALIRHRAATGRDCPAAADQLAMTIRQALAAADRLTTGR